MEQAVEIHRLEEGWREESEQLGMKRDDLKRIREERDQLRRDKNDLDGILSEAREAADVWKGRAITNGKAVEKKDSEINKLDELIREKATTFENVINDNNLKYEGENTRLREELTDSGSEIARLNDIVATMSDTLVDRDFRIDKLETHVSIHDDGSVEFKIDPEGEYTNPTLAQTNSVHVLDAIMNLTLALKESLHG